MHAEPNKRRILTSGSTVLVTGPDGLVDSPGSTGLFDSDTRFLSYYHTSLNGRQSSVVHYETHTSDCAELVVLNECVTTLGRRITRGTIMGRCVRTLEKGLLLEHWELTSHASHEIPASFVIEASADFADMFEVRSVREPRTRAIVARVEPSGFSWAYDRGTFRRVMRIEVPEADSPVLGVAGGIRFDFVLGPRGTWRANVSFAALTQEQGSRRTWSSGQLVNEAFAREQRRCLSFSQIETSAESVQKAVTQAARDLSALCLPSADAPAGFFAAGAPWFLTYFGRDSLVTTLQTLPFSRRFGPTVLRELGRLQAKADDPWRDAEPGKILHEVRFGELAHFHEIPHTPYYGSADATPLYLIALHETYLWTGNLDLVRELLPTGERALKWLDHYGDLDGDGFQEYRRRSPGGLLHQGWKDSDTAVPHANGTPAEPPIALVELQAYAFDAKRRMAHLFEAIGEHKRAERLRHEAETLRARFEATFWSPETCSYCFALDGQKAPVHSIVSNPGHVLWAGMASREHAAATARRLLMPDMFSGWGIRTLSSSHPAYNPFSYQLGGVWPHDTALVAAGLKRYGYHAEALQLAGAILDAAATHHKGQLPELLTGLERSSHATPVQHPDANVPQAWAAGSVFGLIAMILGLRADAPNNRLLVHPTLPPWLPDLSVKGMSIGAAIVDLHAYRMAGRSHYEVEIQQGNVSVVEAASSPET